MRRLAVVTCITAALLAGDPAAGQQQRVEGPHATWGYADAIEIGGTVYVSGVVARGATLEEQLTAVYARLGEVLARFGADLGDVVKETVFTTDMEALSAANGARLAAYAGHTPAATWVQVERLLMPLALLEIEVVAVPGSGSATP